MCNPYHQGSSTLDLTQHSRSYLIPTKTTQTENPAEAAAAANLRAGRGRRARPDAGVGAEGAAGVVLMCIVAEILWYGMGCG
jgi:hypothetical protein